ncbi:MAG: neutral/alkaline non-lysosomal ceramidase N-terminal domain-containing protein [Candidatus Marinimicrobia bacterium]|nr:neutral/alkaline non-lysosomal ceramidase N-terminal domain-containing protein [Candidatus Neomarinimicrobiota bacterium]
MNKNLYAGVGRADITPTEPSFLIGYPHVPRTSTGVHDPLYATALALRRGDQTVILVACDIVFVGQTSARQCRDAIARQGGVPPAQVLISATHTHSGPVTTESLIRRSDPVVPPPDPEYLALFEAGIVRAALDALAALEPATLAHGAAAVSGVGGNRLDPAAPRDGESNLLAVRRADGSPLALAMIYAMHPTVLHEDSTLISADFPAFARQALETEFPGMTVLYHTGTAGNQSPRHEVKACTFAEAERLGLRLAAQIADGLRAIPEAAYDAQPVLAAATAQVDIPPRRYPAVEVAERLERTARETFERLRDGNGPRTATRTAECAWFGAEERVTLARAQASGELAAWQAQFTPAEVQMLRLGGGRWFGLPCEIFVEYGLELKRRLGPDPVGVISLANGELQGYIVTPEADAADGYEAANSLFTPEAGKRLVEAAVRLAK